MAVRITPRDIIFTFEDSCNCCVVCPCCMQKPPDKKYVYINSVGELEYVNSRKSHPNPALAFNRAVAHLQQAIEWKTVHFKDKIPEFSQEIQGIYDSILILRHINMSHIEAINELMLKYFQAKE